MWVPTADLPKSAGHPFYERLNRVLDDAGFDAFVEAQCASFYADGVGRPSLAPGRYFRLLLLGYFEGLDSERAIAWRAADSLSIRTFLDFALHEAPPDHSTLSRTRRLIDLETHQAVFTWVLQRLADATLVVGRTVGIDATTLEANAAMRSIVRRDTGESYDAFLTRLAEASGLSTPTRAELARFDRTRKKKGSNADWTHPHDPDAKIAKMKDGRTHLAHTAEHAVDLDTGAIVGVTVQDASAGDTTTLVDTLVTAAEQVEAGRRAVLALSAVGAATLRRYGAIDYGPKWHLRPALWRKRLSSQGDTSHHQHRTAQAPLGQHKEHSAAAAPEAGRPRGVAARIVTGPHEAHRQDPHLPMRYDTGRPRAVIRLRISQPRTTSLPCQVGLRARRPSPMMGLYRKNAFSTRP